MLISRICIAFILATVLLPKLASCLACYVCTSINRSNPMCEDPLHGSVPIESPCRLGKSGHEGLSYARYCLKIKGTRISDGMAVYIRRCSTQKLGGIHTHGGQFRLSDELYRGYIATCTQNWCNSSPKMFYSVIHVLVCSLVSPLLWNEL